MSEYKEILDGIFKDDPARMLYKVVGQNKKQAEDQYPGIQLTIRTLTEVMNELVRQAKVWYAGKSLWENGMSALDDTSAFFSGKIENLLVTTFSRGVAVGRECETVREAIREHHHLNGLPALDELSSEIKAECAEDPILVEFIAQQAADAIFGFVRSTGLAEATGRDTLRIWEAWKTVLTSVSAGFYVFGIEVGKIYEERKLFEQIVSSTT